MRTFNILDVDLIDFETVEYRNGAKEFEEEFTSCSVSRLTYKFYDGLCNTAEEKLQELTLGYKKFYGIELESEDETNNHPAFFISFSSEYHVLDSNNQVDATKLKNKNFTKDIKLKVLIVTEEAKELLKELAPSLVFERFCRIIAIRFFSPCIICRNYNIP